MGRRRWRLVTGSMLAVLCLALAGCSPFNQGAVTLDERTQLPKLVLTYCEGEAIESVRLVEAPDDGFVYTERRTLWRIEAAQPQRVRSVVVGEVPEGFHEVVPLQRELRGPLLLAAEARGGVAAEQASGQFSMAELKPGVLLQSGEQVSASALRRNADKNCSDSLFGSLGLPTWLDAVAYAGFVGIVVAVIVLYVRGKRRWEQAALDRLPPPPPAPS